MNCGLITLLAVSGTAFGQSVATYTMDAVPLGNGISAGSVWIFTIFGGATSGQIGNESGINGVNLRVDADRFMFDLASISVTNEVFGAANVVVDADGTGFDISFSSNSFIGNNFTAGQPLFSFEGVYNGQLWPEPSILVETSQGNISSFGAATGLPGAFQPSVAYDVVNFASFSFTPPTPGTAAAFGIVALASARRRR
ncbi:MAG: hypothetical protein AAGI53_16095 [Planctomycetota bacterium]